MLLLPAVWLLEFIDSNIPSIWTTLLPLSLHYRIAPCTMQASSDVIRVEAFHAHVDQAHDGAGLKALAGRGNRSRWCAWGR